MRTFSIAVAVAIMLTFICIQESVATFNEVQVPEETMSTDSPVAEYEETSVESVMEPDLEEMMSSDVPVAEPLRLRSIGKRLKRLLKKCRPCSGSIGICCRF